MERMEIGRAMGGIIISAESIRNSKLPYTRLARWTNDAAEMTSSFVKLISEYKRTS
jgi:hypothetical protein